MHDVIIKPAQWLAQVATSDPNEGVRELAKRTMELFRGMKRRAELAERQLKDLVPLRDLCTCLTRDGFKPQPSCPLHGGKAFVREVRALREMRHRATSAVAHEAATGRKVANRILVGDPQ